MSTVAGGANFPDPSFPGVNDTILRSDNYVAYSDLEQYINVVNAPDNRSQLVSTFGDQSITGFLAAAGAVNHVGIADAVTYWEDTRLHQGQKYTLATAIASGASTGVLPINTAATGNANQKRVARLNDVLMLNGSILAFVTATAASSITVAALDGTFGAAIATGVATAPILYNLYGQGTAAPSEFLESNVVRRTNGFVIVKDLFQVSGSQLTNIAWVTAPNGKKSWTWKGEGDTRKRFLNHREIAMVIGQNVSNGAVTNIDGSEGLFAAIEDRGINVTGYLETLADIDLLTAELVQQGAGMNYLIGHNLTQGNKFSNLMGAGLTPQASITAGALEQFGRKGNGMSFDYSGFSRGNYNFSQMHWNLLDDPTLLGSSNYAFVAIPLKSVVDPKTGTKRASMEMNFKSLDGFSRDMIHKTRGLLAGDSNDGRDVLAFDYLSECNLTVYAANQFVLGKKA